MPELVELPGLPEGAICTEVIVLRGYLDSEGNANWMADFRGDSPGNTFIGLLERAKHSLLVDDSDDADPE